MRGVAAVSPTPPVRADVLAVVALSGAAVAIALHSWYSTPRHWTDPDSLFYRANVLRIEGTSKARALAEVFSGPLAQKDRAGEEADPSARRRVSDPAWVEYSSRFYERRWLVPLVAAAFDPWFGADGLIVASLLGYVLLAPFLYLLLRQGFEPWIAASVAGVVLLLPIVRQRADRPLTDSWGLALECLALALGLLALHRGARWLPLWIGAVLALSFARDTTVVVVAGTLVALAARRDRRSLVVFISGLLAALPALLVFGAPLREAMAYTVNDFFPAPSSSWRFVLHHYPHAAHELVHGDVEYLLHHPLEAVVFVGGFLAFLALGRTMRVSWPFVCGAAIASLAELLVLPNYSEFRLELVVIPFSALGLAALVRVMNDRVRPSTVGSRQGAA